MKTWATYLAAVLLGLVTAYLFHASPEALGALTVLNSFLLNLGLCLTLLVMLVTFTAGVASLGREKEGRRVLASSIGWSVLTTFLLAFLAAGLYQLFPSAFPATSTSSLAPDALSSSVSRVVTNTLSSLSLVNPVWTVGTTSSFFAPALLLCLVTGLAAVPVNERIRPAYTALCSFSEVMHRIGFTFTVFGFVLVYSASSVLFLEASQENLPLSFPGYAAVLAAGTAVALFAVLPLLFAVFTHFRQNPYKVLFRAMPALLLSLFTSNRNISMMLEESLSRDSLGIHRRVSSTAVPLLMIIGRGGTAFVSAFTVLALIHATTGSIPGPLLLGLVALAAAIASFFSSAATGAEPAVITVLTLNMLSIELYGAENALIALLPLVAGLGLLLDSAIAMLGTSAAACKLGAVYELDDEDIL